MAASVSNITQIFAFDNNTSTLATVGGADAAMPTINTGITVNGIDDAVKPESPQNTTTALTAGDHYSFWSGNFAASASYDISDTDSAITLHFRNLSPGFTVIAENSDSIWLILFSGGGTTNYGRWHFDGGAGFKNGAWHEITAQGTPDATGGTFDNTDVTGIGMAIESNTTGGTFGFQLAVDQAIHHNGPVVLEDTGGAATVDLDDYFQLLEATGGQTYHSLLVQKSGTTIEFGFPIDIRSDDYDDTATPFGIGFKDGDGIGYKDMPSGFFQLLLTGQASGDQDYGANAVATLSTAYDLTIDGNASSTTLDVNDRVFSVVNDVTISGSGVTFSNTSIISPAGAVDISDYAGSLTITGTSSDIQWTADLAANASLTTDSNIDITFAETDLSDISVVATANLTITVSPTTGSGTYDLTGLSRNGASSIEFDNATANDTTINVTSDINGNHTVASPTAGGGSITVVGPVDTLTVNSSESASQIHVYTTNTQTLLDSESSASQLTYNHSSETVDITVLKDGFIPFRQTGLVLSGDVTVEAQLVPSREYDSSHGLTYTTDASIYDNYNVITNVTQANPAVVTYSGADNYSNNDIISIHDIVGMTEINGKRYTVANVDTGANTFELLGINSTGFTAYSSAGIVVSGLAVPTFGPSGQGVFSLLLESFRTQTALRNLPFNVEMDGAGSLFLTNGVEGEGDSDIENLTACGLAYLDVDGTETAEWVGIEDKGSGPGAGETGEYQQQDGSGTTDARTTGAFDEVVKMYGDIDHGNFDYRGYLVLKYQVNGKYQARVDVPDLYGISSLDPTLYVVSMNPASTGISTGDPAISITITDHTASPITVGGKSFDYEIVDNGTNSAEDILREINYNLSLDATYQSKDPFNWPDMVIETGGNYESQYGRVEGQDTTTTFHGFYVSRSSADHPDFLRFQSNDGTYYTPAVTADITITGMPNAAGAETRLQICNDTAKAASDWAATTAYSQGDKVKRTTGLGSEQVAGLYFVATTAGTSGGSEPTWDTTVGNTTSDGTVTWTCYAILYYNDDPASTGYSDTYTDGEEFSSGDTYRIRFAELDGATSYKTFETTGLTTSAGFAVAVSTTSDSVYATNGLDGSDSSITNKFTADYTNDEIDLDTNSDFAATEAFAYFAYETTTSQGMYEFWGGMTAVDEANYRINTAEVSIFFDETAGFVKQTDSARIFRDDDARPALDPTTGGSGIEINWRNPVFGYDAGGGGFTSTDRATLNSTATQSSVNTVDGNVDLILVDTNELQTDWTDGGRLDLILDARATQASVDTVDGNVDDIKSKTDSLTFTQSGNVDANIQYVNDVEVDGTGADGDEWGPA